MDIYRWPAIGGAGRILCIASTTAHGGKKESQGSAIAVDSRALPTHTTCRENAGVALVRVDPGNLIFDETPNRPGALSVFRCWDCRNSECVGRGRKLYLVSRAVVHRCAAGRGQCY